MRLLLDTNAFLRWTLDRSVPQSVERVLSSPDTESAVSIVTAWEIRIKHSLRLDMGHVQAAIAAMAATLLADHV